MRKQLLLSLWIMLAVAGSAWHTAEATESYVELESTHVDAAERLAFQVTARDEIDRLIDAKLKEQNLSPNAEISDQQFVRRAYLDIVGRVPLIEEADRFVESRNAEDDSSDHRARLIEELLRSEGHVSHSFNFWADILRLTRRLSIGGFESENAYRLWIKDAVRANKPFDQFARELVGARGYVWDNGAIGYYVRDGQAPLENMAHTVRIFLGVRMECAQCHDHPFDRWTRKDYYSMAAFSYSLHPFRYDRSNFDDWIQRNYKQYAEDHKQAVGRDDFPLIRHETELRNYTDNAERFAKLLDKLQLSEDEFHRLAKIARQTYEAYLQKRYAGERALLNYAYKPLRAIHNGPINRPLTLPHDYQYDDGAPGDPVVPAFMFGDQVDVETLDGDPLDAYTAWLTSRKNPTFTKIIANRLWKRVFGHGLFEPLDDYTEDTEASDPQLLAYAEKLMQDLNYDTRAYLEILYNTRAYQRAASADQHSMGQPYYFAGPLLRRMTAEQAWDSVVTLTIPDADFYQPKLAQTLRMIQRQKDVYHDLENRPRDEYVEMAESLTKLYQEISPQQEEAKRQMFSAREQGDREAALKAQERFSQLTSQLREAVQECFHTDRKDDSSDLVSRRVAADTPMMGTAMQAGGMMSGSETRSSLPTSRLPAPKPIVPPEGLDDEALAAWEKFEKHSKKNFQHLTSKMARASELESPEHPTHFLRQFGQSDRQLIENSSQGASIPQALYLLNGEVAETLANPYSVLGRKVFQASEPQQRIETIFRGLLSREPTADELAICLDEYTASGDQGVHATIWAVLNTKQFLFIE